MKVFLHKKGHAKEWHRENAIEATTEFIQVANHAKGVLIKKSHQLRNALTKTILARVVLRSISSQAWSKYMMKVTIRRLTAHKGYTKTRVVAYNKAIF